jgi:hypothetical protein
MALGGTSFPPVKRFQRRTSQSTAAKHDEEYGLTAGKVLKKAMRSEPNSFYGIYSYN